MFSITEELRFTQQGSEQKQEKKRGYKVKKPCDNNTLKNSSTLFHVTIKTLLNGKKCPLKHCKLENKV